MPDPECPLCAGSGRFLLYSFCPRCGDPLGARTGVFPEPTPEEIERVGLRQDRPKEATREQSTE